MNDELTRQMRGYYAKQVCFHCGALPPAVTVEQRLAQFADMHDSLERIKASPDAMRHLRVPTDA